MAEVVLHIYDVTNSGSEKTNNTIVQINRFFKDGIGLGGIFHSAIQVLLFTDLRIYVSMMTLLGFVYMSGSGLCLCHCVCVVGFQVLCLRSG